MKDEINKDIKKDLLTEKIRSVAEIVNASDNQLSKEEISAYFEDIDLTDEQRELIYQYLKEIVRSTEDGQKTEEVPSSAQNSEREVRIPQSTYFQMYLKDIEGIRRYTKEEEDALYKKLIAGDQAAVHQLSEQWLVQIYELAKRYVADEKEFADAIQEGNMGVFLALNQMLGSGKIVDFRQVLMEAAQEAMNDYLLDAAAAKDMDHSLLAKASLVYEAQKFLAENLQRMPTTAELSQYTRLPEEELLDIFAMSKEKK